ncbi:MAG: SMC family ATPase [Chloroflexota bacterium]|nr:SMC family ATPase [Chloroflexota bacterium]
MLPLRLEIRNFIAYRSPDVLVFDGIHLACLTGANGAGKSSLLDAITWALWGEARTRSDDELIHQGQTEMHVILKFEQDGTTYEVARRRQRKARGSTQLDFYAYNAKGERSILSGASVTETDKVIERAIKLSYKTFTQSAFLKQGNADAFTRLGSGERKQMLAKILDLERYDDYEDKAKKQSAAFEKAMDVAASLIKGCDDELRKEPSIRAALEQAQKAQHEAADALTDADARLAEVQSAPDALKAAQTTKTLLGGRAKEHERDLAAAKGDIARAEARFNEAETLIAQADAIADGFRALQTAIADEKIFADKSQQLQTVNAQINALERDIAKARAEYDAQIRAGETKITTLRAQMVDVDAAELDRLLADAASLADAERGRDDLNAGLKPLESERTELTTRNDALNKDLEKLRTRLGKLNRIKAGMCPECGRPLTPEHRDQMQQEITGEGLALKATVETNGARLVALQQQIKQMSVDFETARTTITRLSRARERAAALQTQAESAARARMEIDGAQTELDAVLSIVAREDYAHDARARLTTARAEHDAIGYDDARYTAARRDLDQYRDYASRQTLLDKATAELPDLQAALADARARQHTVEDKQRATAAESAQVDVEIVTLTARVADYHARKEEADRQRRREREAMSAVTIAEQELYALAVQRERKTDYERKLGDAREQKAVYDELKLAFGKKGIPAMIIETAIPELEVAANDLLGRMTNGRMSLKLETQRERKSADGVIETLDIQIADELGTRNYELYSGGEAFRIDFALRVALSKMLARRAGAPLHTLFVDEGFGTQDDDGREKLVEAITAIQDDFKLILVITHIEELRDSFEVQIQISKTGEGSRISVR